MKKILSVITVLLLLSALVLTASAASASATLTGPGTVRAGDTITLSFNLSGSDIYGVSGALSYDSSQVTLTGTSQKIASPWVVEFNGNNFVAYDNNLSSPINSSKVLFTASFKVKDVAVGTNIKISCTGVTASDGSADINVGTVTYSATTAAPLSTNNKLSALTVSNATVSPAFSADTTSYTAEVPYEVSKLDVKATAADSKATVSINSPTLTPNGTTNVTVTVTAEDGSKKTYTISVKRAQDPNYVASSENSLSGITVEGFLLSPVFSADNTSYVVWAPYETESVTVTGAAVDSRASVRTEGGEALVAGQDNAVKVICTAEDGTEKVYTVTVKRAAPHDETADEPTKPTEPEPTEPQPTEPAPTEPVITEPEITEPTVTQPDNTDTPDNPCGFPWWSLVLAVMAGAAIGIVIGITITKRKK